MDALPYADQWDRPGPDSSRRLMRSARIWFVVIMALTAVVPTLAVALLRRWHPAFAETIATDHQSLQFIGNITLDLLLIGYALHRGRQVGYGRLVDGLGLYPIEKPGLLVFLCLATLVVPITFGAIQYVTLHSNDGYLILEQLHRTAERDGPVRLTTIFILVICAPFAEELYFRGWLWTGLEATMTRAAVFCCTGALFLIVHIPHGGLLRVLILFPAAFFIGAARMGCRSTWASMLVHVTNNLAVAATMVWLSRQ